MSSDFSAELATRLRALGVPFKCNDNISCYLSRLDLDRLEGEVAVKMAQVLRALVIDTEGDPNTHETAQRWARMMVREAFVGRYTEPPRATDFPNARHLDEIYAVGPITVRSTCAHHLLPILGQCWVAVKPTERIIGLSKFSRLASWVLARPHIQEEAVIILADTIEELIKPHGLAVVIRAEHQCMTFRGVRDAESTMVTSVMRGFFRDDDKARGEVMQLLRAQGF
jgi:GTP cyclohydrolase I